jgi:aspartate carbamoyltransferase catalytic subunit
MSLLSQKHLTGIADLTAEDITLLLNHAESFQQKLARGVDCSHFLKKKNVLLLFFEDSTRTRISFEIAAKNLGANFINWEAKKSSASKGESFHDTVRTLNAMQPDAMIIRHHEFGAPHFVSTIVDCPVINAGDSWNEHPTQALLDALTLRQHFGKIEGLRIAICGDIAHSRVAASNMRLLSKLGALIHIVAPPALMPEKFSADVQCFNTLEDGLKGCDAVMMLRNQKERMQAGLIESDEAFFRDYGLTKERLAAAADGAVVLHPGPMNRGVEIADDVADDPDRSLILTQVANGIPVRMAVMDLLMGGGAS